MNQDHDDNWNKDALDAFTEVKSEIDSILYRLEALSDKNYNLAPKDVHWGHVAVLEFHAKRLREFFDDAANLDKVENL